MRRRDFIKTGTILAAGMPMVSAAPYIQRQPEVIILGAGLAGLGAALRLQEMGAQYTLLEARNRIGGRVNSHVISPENGLTVELGAEWIGESHTELLSLCESLDLEILDHRFDTALLLNGSYSKANEWAWETGHKKLEEKIKAFPSVSTQEEKNHDTTDWWRYLKNLGLSERDLEIRELLDSTDFGETIRNVSAFSALSEYAYSSPKNEMDYIVKGGNSQIIEKLADKIGRQNILTSHKVTRVSQVSGRVTVTCENGKTFTADKVICTLPTFAVTQIQWEPTLPEAKQDALAALQYCRIMKFSVLFSERFWKEEAFDLITDTPAHYFFHSTKLQPGKEGVLTAYTTGDKAYLMSKMSPQQRKKMVAEALDIPFGKVDDYILKVAGYYWGNDPLTQGAYAIYDTHQWFTLLPTLHKPFKHIHFAGEHIAEWQGFMEGAFVTGKEAAEAAG
ncbi:MAG: NAD(P)/FAD-dependent oxidoreductase [Bacteroidia bacterium]|nr:NAD(P)/FAD-dependent oxidoreductase [Bacteroidia bacterium]